MPDKIYQVAAKADGGVDENMLTACKTYYSVDDVEDALEILDVQDSWLSAEKINAKADAKAEAAAKRRSRRG